MTAPDQVKVSEIIGEIVERARRDIAREQTDFVGRMQQAMCEFEGLCDEHESTDWPTEAKTDTAEALAALIGLALAQLAIVRFGEDAALNAFARFEASLTPSVGDGERARALILALEDFINEPPRRYDVEPIEVRDYRHEAYRVWSPVRDAFLAMLKQAALSAPAGRDGVVEALEPFARMGELIELETTGFDDEDELSLIIEDGHLLDRFKVGDFRRARAALKKDIPHAG